MNDSDGVESVRIATWTASDQSDLIWRNAHSNGEGAWFYDIPYNEHNSDPEMYINHIYAYDSKGNKSVKEIVFHHKSSVIFDANGGSVSTKSKVVTFNDKYDTLPIPVRNGYLFDGWYTNKKYETKITENSSFIANGDQTLYAKWKVNTATTTITQKPTTTTTTSITTTQKPTTTTTTQKPTTTTTTSTTTTQKPTTTTTTSTTTTQKPTTTTTTSTTTTQKPTTTTTTSTTTTQTPTTTTTNSFHLENTDISLSNGDQYTIPLNLNDITYKSTNTDVAVVSPKGIITAVGIGEAIINIIDKDYNVIQLKVSVKSDNPEQISYELGDVNNDGQINAVDASSVLSYYAMISTNKDGGYNDNQIAAADVNHDGQVNAVDASSILAYYAYVSTTKEDILPIEEYLKKK